MARSVAVWQQTRHELVGRWAQASVTMITHDPGGPVEHWQPSLVGVRPPVPDERRRLYDLALCLPCCRDHLYLIAPDEREREVRSQLCRPSLAIDGCPRPAYVLFSELAENFSSLSRFGDGLSTLKKLARQV